MMKGAVKKLLKGKLTLCLLAQGENFFIEAATSGGCSQMVL